MKYFKVVTTFDNRGRVKAGLTAIIESASCPEGSCESRGNKDVYVDYFPSELQALNFIADARRV